MVYAGGPAGGLSRAEKESKNTIMCAKVIQQKQLIVQSPPSAAAMTRPTPRVLSYFCSLVAYCCVRSSADLTSPAGCRGVICTPCHVSCLNNRRHTVLRVMLGRGLFRSLLLLLLPWHYQYHPSSATSSWTHPHSFPPQLHPHHSVSFHVS